MSGPDFSGLGDIAKAQTRKPTKGWEPLTVSDLAPGRVLAFDQSLTATGWVDLQVIHFECTVRATGKFGGGLDDLARGVERDLRRGVIIFEAARTLIGAIKYDSPIVDVVHESPPHAGNVKGGGTGSLMSAQSVRNAAWAEGVGVTMLGAQPGKRLVCGNANAGKTEAHAGLKEHCFPWIHGSDKITNEAQRDALMVALLHLHRKKG